MSAPERANVVVVDDDVASATATARLLGKIGCRTRICTDALGAAALALEDDVDLVGLDLGMPSLDGYEVLTLIRSHEQTRRSPSVPVVAITGRVSAQDRAQALAVGFAAYLAKPVTLAALRDAPAGADKACPRCGETNPGNFLSCWQCGGALTDQDCRSSPRDSTCD